MGRVTHGVSRGSALLVAAALCACGGNARIDHAGTDGASGMGGALGGSSAGGAAQESTCPDGVPSADQIAATPRANTNLELLALKLSTGVVADQAIYDRVVRDVPAIGAQAPELMGISYYPPDDGRTLLLTVDPNVLGEMQQGTYHDWDCLNDSYVLDQTTLSAAEVAGFSSFATLQLKGIYAIDQVATQYGTLRGIVSAEQGAGAGHGPTVCLTAEGELWHYVFDQASGDCIAGCIDHVYTHFTTAADGTVVPLGDIPAAADSPYISVAACR